jgi:mono/diheme cytochrome c family protein
MRDRGYLCVEVHLGRIVVRSECKQFEHHKSGHHNPRDQQQPDFSKNTWELPKDADKTKNPVPSSEESIMKGSELYAARDKGNCVFCHGDKGSGNEATLPRLRRKPGDLTNKERMAAMTDGELFWKISKGINGIMPAGEKRMSEEERWQVVNFIKTLPEKGAKP